MLLPIVAFIIGGAVGFGIAKIFSRVKPIGTLRLDRSDPDGPHLFLELNADPNTIVYRKHVVLNVNVKNYISH